jgi:hypothetical protein
VISTSQTYRHGLKKFSWTRVMKLDSGSPTYPCIFSPRFTTSQSSPSSAKPTISQSKEPSYPHPGEIIFLITPETIDQMMQISRADSVSPFNLEIITELYQKMSFPQRAQIFELFLPQYAQFPTTNPPYPSSLFSIKGNQIITSLCALLGYFSDQWVDEPILGFLSIFSTDEKPTTQFDFSTFLVDNIHEQFINFSTEGMFRYSSILAYLFVFFQADKFSFSMQKMDEDGRPQAVTTWTSLLRHNSMEFSFK